MYFVYAEQYTTYVMYVEYTFRFQMGTHVGFVSIYVGYVACTTRVRGRHHSGLWYTALSLSDSNKVCWYVVCIDLCRGCGDICGAIAQYEGCGVCACEFVCVCVYVYV